MSILLETKNVLLKAGIVPRVPILKDSVIDIMKKAAIPVVMNIKTQGTNLI